MLCEELAHHPSWGQLAALPLLEQLVDHSGLEAVRRRGIGRLAFHEVDDMLG